MAATACVSPSIHPCDPSCFPRREIGQVAPGDDAMGRQKRLTQPPALGSFRRPDFGPSRLGCGR